MSEKDTITKIKENQGLLSKIQNFFTRGYGIKEDLRELDKKLRDSYYQDLRELRHKWGEAYLEVLEANPRSLKRNFKKVIQTLDRVSAQINRADYGYAGLMDRKGHIREKELASVFGYDQEMGEHIEKLKVSIEEVYTGVEEREWTAVRSEVKSIRGLLDEIETKWAGREDHFRSLEA
jgi:hypothetical protein